MLVRSFLTSVKLSASANNVPGVSGGLPMKKLLACAAILALTLSTAELFAGERERVFGHDVFGHDAKYRAATLDEAQAKLNS